MWISLYCATDPGVTHITQDIGEFLSAIGSLSADGGGDCREPSIGALSRAIEASEPGSPIYVFTDDLASDEDRLAEVEALIQETGVTVSYVITAGCSKGKRFAQGRTQHSGQNQLRWRRQMDDDVYSFIAAVSGGQVLGVEANEISELSSLISFSAMQTPVTIFYKTSSITPEAYIFPVDESMDEVLISINGNGIAVNITSPTGSLKPYQPQSI